MPYLEILSEIADALFPLAMLLNGFSLGYLVTDYLHEKSRERRSKKQVTANPNTFPGHDGPEAQQEPNTKSKP